jgi:hypothetical protein
MQAKNIITGEELKALLSPEELQELDLARPEPFSSVPAANGKQLDFLVQTMCEMQSLVSGLLAKVDKLENLLLETTAVREAAAAADARRIAEEQSEPVEGSDTSGLEEPEPVSLIPRSVKHGKKKPGLRKFF